MPIHMELELWYITKFVCVLNDLTFKENNNRKKLNFTHYCFSCWVLNGTLLLLMFLQATRHMSGIGKSFSTNSTCCSSYNSSVETVLKVLHLSHGVEQIRTGWKRGNWMWSDAEPKEQLLGRDRAMSLMGYHLWVCIFILTRSCHDKEGQQSSITLSAWVCVKCSGRTTRCRCRRCRVAGDGQSLSSKAWLCFICWFPLYL